MNIAVIFAGGTGQRMNSKTRPKQFLELHEKPILVYTLEAFQKHEEIASNLILTALHYINSRKIEKEKVYDFKFCLLSVLVVTISCLLCNLIYKFTWVRYGVILIIILIVFKFRNKLINSITAMKV